jgi:hypothetical protein
MTSVGTPLTGSNIPEGIYYTQTHTEESLKIIIGHGNYNNTIITALVATSVGPLTANSRPVRRVPYVSGK